MFIECKFSNEDIFKCANIELGRYSRMNVINFIILPKILGIKKGKDLDWYIA